MFEKRPRVDSYTLANVLRGAAVAILVLLACLPAKAATIYNFDFENDAIGQTTAFTDVSNGVAAMFEDAGPLEGSFMVLPSVFGSMNGNALYSLSPDGILRITFSQDVYGLAFNFALGSSGDIRLRAYDSAATPVRETYVNAVVDVGGEPYEGQLSLAYDPGFRVVEVRSSSSAGFVVDNLEPVPEPGTLLQFASGVGMLIAAWCRRKRIHSIYAVLRT